MQFKDLLDYCKAEAICNTLIHTEHSIWRQICRSYSEKFHTPLYLCLDGTISPEDILLAEFESQLENFDDEKDLESILDQIYRLEDPEYDKEVGKELNEFIKKVEKEEKERIKSGKPIHKGIKNIQEEVDLKNTSEKSKATQMPTSGGINLSYLSKEDSESGGFD